jgi:DNA-binding CsgD family transcriptional regulator
VATRGGDVIAELAGQEALARLALATGGRAAAADHFDALLARWRRMGVRDPWYARFVPEHVEALVAAGRLDDATSLLDWWQRTGRRAPRPWAEALASRAGAALRVASGDLQGALDRLSEAGATAETLPPYERGRTLLMLGSLERRLKRRAAARGSLGRAQDAFRRIGAERWVEEVERELARLGEPSPSAALTATEARIAELAAQGLSNVEVAERLFLSARTVECNLTSVYRKLAVTRRGHLAGRLAAGAGGGTRPSRTGPPLESSA